MGKKKGWHANGEAAPHRGKGRATVEPLRKKRDILAIKRLLSEHPRDLALFTVGINVGLRGGDLLALKFSDILSPEDNIKTALEVVERKTDKLRRIKLCKNARTALEALLPADMDDLDTGAYIFPSRKGGKMTVQRLHQLVNQWATEAGVKGHFGSHTLRKTYGFQHWKRGVDITLLMRIFGHSSPSVTLRYIGSQQEEIDEANLRANF